ncbi:hypothetical protein JTF08_13755 [Micrococcaceae bacterium RIT802]|nr:hypothetical protein [Micrococcaceae bacterium RIT 802]
MAVDRVPFFVGGGAEHSPEVVRGFIYDSTGGAEGVSSVGGMRVLAQAVPNGTVRVVSGGCLLNNRYPGGAGQSYEGRNATQTDVAITATGSGGGRTDLIVARVLDPQYEGQPPADPNAFDYFRLAVIQGVPSGTLTFKELNLDYPAIELAKVTLPSSTATITQAMITDLRTVAQPREKTVVMPRPNVTGDAGMALTSRGAYPAGEWFPNVGGNANNGRYDIPVPSWATRMQIRCEWLSVRYKANPGAGYYWVAYGPDSVGSTPTSYTQGFGWDSDDATSTTNWLLEQEVPIPSAWRGTTIPFVPRANKTTDTSYPGSVALTARSGMVFSVRFLEVADV